MHNNPPDHHFFYQRGKEQVMKRTTPRGPRFLSSGWLTAVIGLVTVAVVFTGCRKSSTDPQASIANPERNHITQMLSIYRAYLQSHNNKPPANPEALKDWAMKEGQEKLKIHDSVENALKSPRDGQPYAFVPPPKGRKMAPQTFMVYEQQGKSGKHYFAGEMGVVGEMSDTQISEAVQSAGGK
jgi:hypothetical protein